MEKEGEGERGEEGKGGGRLEGGDGKERGGRILQ